MRQQDKKDLRVLKEKLDNLRSEFEDFADNHKEWMDERDNDTDGKFSESPTGQRADDEQYYFEDWVERLQSIYNEIEEEMNV